MNMKPSKSSENSNPLKIFSNLGWVLSSISGVGVIIGAFLTIDSRYAQASDVKELVQAHKEFAQQITKEQKNSINLIRKQMLEDKIFEKSLIPNEKRTQTDRALLERYKEELKFTERQMRGD